MPVPGQEPATFARSLEIGRNTRPPRTLLASIDYSPLTSGNQFSIHRQTFNMNHHLSAEMTSSSIAPMTDPANPAQPAWPGEWRRACRTLPAVVH